MVKSVWYVRKEYCFQKRLVSANFKKRAIPKPARIPPQTPPAGGKSAEAGRILSPRQIVSPCRVRISIFNRLDFARNSFELRPIHTANWEIANLKRLSCGVFAAARQPLYCISSLSFWTTKKDKTR